NNVGLILSDGASIILNYNPASETIDVGDKVEAKEGVGIKSLPVGGGKSKDFVYTTGVTRAIDFVMDVNGSKKPNSEVNTSNRDIRSFKIASFNKGDPCTKYPNSTYVEEIGCVVDLGVNCINERPYFNNNNCWAGAKQACSDIGMSLPDTDFIESVRKKPVFIDLVQNDMFWTSTETNSFYAYFYLKSGSTVGYSSMDKNAGYKAMCIGN
ncbi:hypothetical protein J6P92_05095, partial [bacterium]|nr:hypothetical protein [bacterium]